MKTFLLAFTAGAALALIPCKGDDNSLLVPNGHGGYNVIQGGGRPKTIPFFGPHGFAAQVQAHVHDKPKFILRFVAQDDGHGNKHMVAKKFYYGTAEEAEAANVATP